MSGEPAVLVADPHGRARSFVAALARFPTKPRWVVVGGFAVYVRITDIHRFTHDLDTVCRNQPSLIDILVADAGAERLAAAKLGLGEDGAPVVVDVMADTTDEPLPAAPGERMFALGRRMALATSALTEIVVVGDESVVARTSAPIATSASLIALKAVAIPHRSQGSRPAKVGSDIHDLVRLVQSCDRSDVVGSISEFSAELSDWVGTTLIKWFSPEQDLRYTFARLRHLARSPDAQALGQDDLAAVGELGRALISPYGGR